MSGFCLPQWQTRLARHMLQPTSRRARRDSVRHSEQPFGRWCRKLPGDAEDYDINVGRHFVQGVDVWLNNPRRPLEASGTSGQKVVLNGGLNLSVLDGWWAEAYDGLNGFAIGTGRTHSNVTLHDARDGEELYRVLRDEVIPLYYQRDGDGLPRRWFKRVKRAIRTLGWRFNADRMVMDYTLKCYLPAAGGTSRNTRVGR